MAAQWAIATSMNYREAGVHDGGQPSGSGRRGVALVECTEAGAPDGEAGGEARIRG